MEKEVKGIPEEARYGDTAKIPLNQLLTYVDQLHEARRAGTHHDIRFGDRELFSWAGRYGLPATGERAALFQQPLHSSEYADFEGEIPEGRGAGRVTTHDRGNATVTEAGPDKIKFTLTHKEPPENYTMIRMQGKNKPWLVLNSATTHVEKAAADFAPDYTPEDLRRMGVYEEVYDRTKPRLASLNSWPEHWFHPEDKMGWLEWYEKYNAGRRMEDDDRQIRRWAAFKARHGGKAFQENPTPRRAYALRNWGIDPVKLLNQEENQVKLMESMRTYKDKKYEKAACDWLGYCEKLQKEATTIGATKSLIRSLKNDGIKIVRTVADAGLPHPTQRWGLKMRGPSYLPEQKTIYLPRFKGPGPARRGRAKAEFKREGATFINNSRLNEYGGRAQQGSIFADTPTELPFTAKHSKPRQILFHEGGHALHHLNDPAAFTRRSLTEEAAKKQFEQLMEKRHSTKEFNALINKIQTPAKKRVLAIERTANNNAVNFMQNQNVQKSLIEEYIRAMEKGYGTYLMSVGTPQGKPWDYTKYFPAV